MSEPATKAAGIYCKQCGYDLRASKEAGRCPECGRAFAPGDPKSFYPRPFAAPWKRALGRWATRAAMLLLVFGLLLGGVWGWLYREWKQEQPALAHIQRAQGACCGRVLGGAAGEWLCERRVPGSFVLARLRIVYLTAGATDADLAALRNLRWMETLVLDGPITDAGLAQLRGLSRLRILSVTSPELTDAGLSELKHLPRLESLTLEGARLTAAGLSELKHLPQLESLTLTSAPLTDADLVPLESLGKLRDLRLGYTKVTDAGLIHLEKLTGLKHLVLWGTKVTPAGAERLQAALPGCEIKGP